MHKNKTFFVILRAEIENIFVRTLCDFVFGQ